MAARQRVSQQCMRPVFGAPVRTTDPCKGDQVTMSNLPMPLPSAPPVPWRANAAVVAALAAVAYMLATGHPGDLGATVQRELRGPLLFLVSAQSLVIIPAIFLAERVMPANPAQKSFSPSVVVDAFMMMVLFPATHGSPSSPPGPWGSGSMPTPTPSCSTPPAPGRCGPR